MDLGSLFTRELIPLTKAILSHFEDLLRLHELLHVEPSAPLILEPWEDPRVPDLNVICNDEPNASFDS